ncbi:cold-inducible RNA-binding protein-like isoform X1 [Mytilus californianus]|uniref:cold-inducible RNA-binding protein-like isoform X1 n=2 Tax=Mytilus californianus TaxID=6549 RepID=UPI0022460489|nr:cold-inducible RNA-binding protein-like isoform X1 [Mytilus californianus]
MQCWKMVKIFVGNLSQSTAREDIQMMFEKYGKVTECDVLKNYGFVHMASSDEAEKAIQELDGASVKGSRMRVEKSTGKSSRGGGRGGGGKMRGGRGGGRGGDRYGGGGGGGYGDPYRRPPPYGGGGGGGRDSYDRYGGGSRDRMPISRGYDSYDRRPPPMDDYRDRGYGGYGSYDARRSEYDRYDRPPARDPYYSDRGAAARPPPEYYNRRPPPGPEDDRLTGYSNGHDADNYYDRFYKKPAPPPQTQKSVSQGFLQSEPYYF